MTDREKAIIMAFTGKCMLAGDKFQIFHKYVEEILGRPVLTHDMGWLESEIKEKAMPDFLELCEETDTKGCWLVDKDGGFTCDDCGTWSTRASRYCPDCGREMKIENDF